MKLSVDQLLEVMRVILENKRSLLSDADEETSDQQNEFSTAGAIAGVTVPLGAGPTHPIPTVDGKRKRRKRSKR
jgi:hypothetical protein